MFVSHKKRYLPHQNQDQDKYSQDKVSHVKLKIISGNVTRANSRSKVNLDLDQSSIAFQEINQLRRSGIQNIIQKNYQKSQKKNRKMLTLSAKKQHKNGSLNKNKEIINNYQKSIKNQQKRSKPIFACEQICRISQLNDKVVLQTPAKKNIRCAISLTNSQIESDKKMFMNPQMKDFSLNGKYETPRQKKNFQSRGLGFKNQLYISPVNYDLQTPQSSLISKYQIKSQQKQKTIQKNFTQEYAKQSFNRSTEEPSFQIFDPTQNNQLNLTEIFRQTIKQNKDQQELESGRTTIIDFLKDLQQSQNNSIKNKSNQKFKTKTKVNFFY